MHLSLPLLAFFLPYLAVALPAASEEGHKTILEWGPHNIPSNIDRYMRDSQEFIKDTGEYLRNDKCVSNGFRCISSSRFRLCDDDGYGIGTKIVELRRGWRCKETMAPTRRVGGIRLGPLTRAVILDPRGEEYTNWKDAEYADFWYVE